MKSLVGDARADNHQRALQAYFTRWVTGAAAFDPVQNDDDFSGGRFDCCLVQTELWLWERVQYRMLFTVPRGEFSGTVRFEGPTLDS